MTEIGNILIGASMAGMLILFSCSTGPEDKGERMQARMEKIYKDMQDVDPGDREEFEKERRDILGDLRDLMSDLNDDISDTEKELAKQDLEKIDRERHGKLRTELKRQANVVGPLIRKVENAGIREWEDIRTETTIVFESAELLYDREGLEHRRWDGVRKDEGEGNVRTGTDLDLDRNAEEVR